MNIYRSSALYLLLFSLFACSKEPKQKPCPPSQEYGLVRLTEESLAYIPDSYKNNEKLIFKNAEGELLTFYPGQDTFDRDTRIHNSVRQCGESGDVHNRYAVEHLSVGYRSTKRHFFNLDFKVALRSKKSEEYAWQDVFVDFLDIYYVELDDDGIPFEDFCWVREIPLSFHGEEPFDLETPYISYTFHQELLIGGRLYNDVYEGDCPVGSRIFIQKNSGVVAFTDQEGVDWFLEYTESFEEEVAPDLALPDTAGQMVSLSEVEGELILIDLWASWCTPCRVETQETLKPLYDQYADKGLSIYSVSLDTEREEWIEAIIEDEMVWHQVSDLQGYSSPVLTQYQVYGIPTIYVVDEQRNILSKNMRGEELKQFVEAYLD
jgi:thiol-disulfide isomerase/thioredoxin